MQFLSLLTIRCGKYLHSLHSGKSKTNIPDALSKCFEFNLSKEMHQILSELINYVLLCFLVIFMKNDEVSSGRTPFQAADGRLLVVSSRGRRGQGSLWALS